MACVNQQIPTYVSNSICLSIEANVDRGEKHCQRVWLDLLERRKAICDAGKSPTLADCPRSAYCDNPDCNSAACKLYRPLDHHLRVPSTPFAPFDPNATDADAPAPEKFFRHKKRKTTAT